MAALYIGHDVSIHVAPLLRQWGHDVVVTSELLLGSESDPFHLLNASRAGRILVSHNARDYFLLHRAWHEWSKGWPVYPDSGFRGRLAYPLGRFLLRAHWHAGIVLPWQGPPNRIASDVDGMVSFSRGPYRPVQGVLWRQRRDLQWDYHGHVA